MISCRLLESDVVFADCPVILDVFHESGVGDFALGRLCVGPVIPWDFLEGCFGELRYHQLTKGPRHAVWTHHERGVPFPVLLHGVIFVEVFEHRVQVHGWTLPLLFFLCWFPIFSLFSILFGCPRSCPLLDARVLIINHGDLFG